MKYLVTGGSGYFGTVLCKYLCQKNLSVTNIDVHDSSLQLENLTNIKSDIFDLTNLRSVLKNIDVVFHNVAAVPILKNKQEFIKSNIEATKLVLEEGIKLGVKKFVYTSSSAVIGVPKENPVTEEYLCEPFEDYGIAKLAGEQVCKELFNKNIDIAILRPRTILGSGRLGIFQILFDWVNKGGVLPLIGNGDNIYQFVHALDLADACFKASKQNGFNIYNVGADDYGTMRETLDYLCKYSKNGSRTISLPKLFVNPLLQVLANLPISPVAHYHAKMYGSSFFFNTDKIKKQLKWKPKYSNNEMIVESYEEYKKNLNLITKANYLSSPHKSALKQGVLSILQKVLRCF